MPDVCLQAQHSTELLLLLCVIISSGVLTPVVRAVACPAPSEVQGEEKILGPPARQEEMDVHLHKGRGVAYWEWAWITRGISQLPSHDCQLPLPTAALPGAGSMAPCEGREDSLT